MLRFEPAALVESDVLADYWNRRLPKKFRVDAQLIRMLGRHHMTYLHDASFVAFEGEELVGFIETKASPSELYSGPDPDLIHVHSLAFRDVEIGTSLITQVLGVFPSNTLVFGQDNGHFWPGVPLDWDEGRAVLDEMGFQPVGGESVDVERDLVDFEPLKSVELFSRDGVDLKRGKPGDGAKLDAFMRQEFPGRWRYDVLQKFSKEPADLFLLWLGESVQGFAFTQTQATTEVPIGGAVWHHDLGENWGALGPIGVGQKVRGMGFGGALLAGSLDELKKGGVRRCIIDWTDLAEFYAKCGFEVTRRYQGMSFEMSS